MQLRQRLLQLPLLYKLLIANSAIVALGAIVGTIGTVWHMQRFPDDVHFQLILFFATAGLAISFVVNYAVLKVALRPLDRLQAGVDEIRRGNTGLRIIDDPLTDERFMRLTATFNQMLDTLEEDAERLHRLSGAIIEAQEEERRRIARELHDEAAQALTSLLVRIRLLERSPNPEEARRHVQELRQLTAAALEEVRRVALELRPTILDDLGLAAALDWRVEEFNAVGGTRATLSVEGIGERLPGPVELALFRVAQEALTNVARHAQATTVSVGLRRAAGDLVLTIEDNGVGFDPTPPGGAGSRGLGLVGMRERMSLVGGELTLVSRPGHGTRIMARVPLDRQPAHPLAVVARPPPAGEGRPAARATEAGNWREANP